MTKYIFAVLIVLSLIGVGVVWVANMAVQAERAKTLQVAVEKMAERDKVKKIAKEASEEDLCRMLGGVTIDGACQ
jgi:hypothetical protein